MANITSRSDRISKPRGPDARTRNGGLPLSAVGAVTLLRAARLSLAFGDGQAIAFPAGTVLRRLAGDAWTLAGHRGCVLVQSRSGNVFAAPTHLLSATRRERKPQL